MMKVGLLGGSFNPPHQGHLHISNIALKRMGLNQIWWIPTAYNPLKDKNIYDNYPNRIYKCQQITKNHPQIYVKKFDEIYTEKLIKQLRKKYKNIEFFWLMGADNLENLHKWEGFKKLFANITTIIVSRETFLSKIKKTKAWKFISLGKYHIIYGRKLDISSTQIRNNYTKK